MPRKLVPRKVEGSAPRKDHGWRAAHERTKTRKRVRLALVVLGLVAGLIISAQFINLVRIFMSPWQTTSISKSYFWDSNFNINLVVKGRLISVVSLRPSSKIVTILPLPDETYLEVPGEFGRWRLSSIYDLGQSTKFGGGKLLKNSISTFLGIPIDGFLLFTDSFEQKEILELVEIMRGNPLGSWSMLPHLQTDLTLWELVRLKWHISAVRFDKVETLDLLQLEVLDKEKLADGTAVYTFDPIKLDSVFTELSDPKVSSEHLSVAVFNATNHPGLAQKAARVITNIGGNVIITSNSDKKYDKTYLWGEPSATLTRLTQIFGSAKISPIEDGIASSRAHINILVGEDFYQDF